MRAYVRVWGTITWSEMEKKKNIQIEKVYYRSLYYTLAPEVFLEMVLRERESGRWDKDSFFKASSGCKTDDT